MVKPIELTVEIAARPEAVFAAMTDPARMPRWLPHTEAIEDPSGQVGEAGTTFIQRASAAIRRPGSTIAAAPDRSWHLRLDGFGERVDAIFRLEERIASTRVRFEARVQNGPALLAPLLNRLGSGLDRRSWSEALTRLKDEVERAAADIRAGTVYSLDSRAGIIRVGQVLAADDRHAHLRLYAQRFTKRPQRNNLTALRLDLPGHYGEIQPLTPTLKGAVRGRSPVTWLLADGGFGLAHIPVTRAALDAAAPVPLFDAGVTEDHLVPVTAWRIRQGRPFGEAPEPMIGAYLSVVRQEHGFGVMKLLRSEELGAHVRLYGTIFEERPTTIDELSLEPPVAPSDHLALTHPSLARWRPEFLAMAVVQPDELIGYEAWRRAKGGFT